MRLILGFCLGLFLALSAAFAGPAVAASQATVKASSAWIKAPQPGSTEATAFVVVDNPTMYDIYVVGAESDVAESIELRETPDGARVVKEATVPAYGQLAMSADSVHFVLKGLTRSLAAGNEATLVIYTDVGERLTITAQVK